MVRGLFPLTSLLTIHASNAATISPAGRSALLPAICRHAVARARGICARTSGAARMSGSGGPARAAGPPLPEHALAPPMPADSAVVCVISHDEAVALARLRECAPADGDRAVLSVENSANATLNLGRTTPARLALSAAGVGLEAEGGGAAAGAFASWSFLGRVAKKGRAGAWQCYGGDEPRKIVTFSELTRRTASLLPTEAGAPPTALLGGFNMHRVKRVHPGLDTAAKLDALGRKLRGVGLDVCTGLGYTAIASSRKPAVSEVVTI